MKKIYLLFLSFFATTLTFAQTVLIDANPGVSQNIIIGPSNYHVSETIYLNDEIGTTSFTTFATSIKQIGFSLNVEGASATVNNYNIYMKDIAAGITTFANGAYSTAGYTLVFSGTYVAAPAGFTLINLTTPFIRTAGSNLQVLIVRLDNINRGAGVATFDASIGNITSNAALSSRRYNNTTAPVSGVTSLTASTFRPLIVLRNVSPIDALVNDILFPTITCFSTPQTVSVEIFNSGTLPIAAGAASTTLKISGANSFTGTQSNAGIIAPGDFEVVSFPGVSFSNPGPNFDTAIVTVAGDGDRTNDTLGIDFEGATTLSSFPLVEDVETTLPVFNYLQVLAFDQLWRLQDGDYTNLDQTAPLVARAPGTMSFLFDSYSGGNSTGFSTRLFSNCINMASISSPVLTFWMSHDNVFLTELDSMYVSVSNDRGVTWTRLAGFRRPDATATTPVWRLETLSLAAYQGQTIQIGFEGVSKYGNAISIDDITISGVLPVSMLSFEASKNGSVNVLNWRTGQEANSSRFEVERSIDAGRTYQKIGQVLAAGNSNSERNYRFTDIAPVKGINYYRLRVVDLDNSFKYSLTRNVRNLSASDFSMAPNPVQQKMSITLESNRTEKAIVSITDMSGKLVQSNIRAVVAGSNNLFIDTDKLASGSYFIKVEMSDSKIVKKFTRL